MEKTYNNCYREENKLFCAKKIGNTCRRHEFRCQKCNDKIANYKLEGENYCFDCLIEEFDLEESTTINYYLEDECIGTSDDRSEVISNLDGVEEIE